MTTSSRRDDLARRLAERLEKAPSKGRVMSASSTGSIDGTSDDTSAEGRVKSARSGAGAGAGVDAEPAPSAKPRPQRPARAKRPSASSASGRSAAPTSRPRRGAPGTVLRGHLVPHEIHGEARRRKAELRASHGARVTWDDVVNEGLAVLVEQPDLAASMVDEVGRRSLRERRRLVQATLSAVLDRRLVDVHLDLSERADAEVTYEQLWTAAIVLWLRTTDGGGSR